MSNERDERYEQIMRRIAERRAEQEAAPKREAQDDLARVLDSVDAWGKLDFIRRSKGIRKLTYGPKAVSGLTPMIWVGIVIWRRGSGYHGYKQLQLLGIWAYDDGGTPTITVGTRWLAFSAPFYDADAYQKLIRKNFDLYYEGEVTPPTNGLYTTIYTPERRLAIREEIRAALQAWVSA